jgi:hypothetical protein
VGRKVTGCGHSRFPYENRDNSDAAFEGGRNLDADVVVRIVDTPAAGGSVSICGIEPAISDDCEQDARLIQRFANPATEVVAIANGVNVKKEPVAPEPAFEMIEYSAGDVGGVLAAVREKDPGHGAAGQRRSPAWNIKAR